MTTSKTTSTLGHFQNSDEANKLLEMVKANLGDATATLDGWGDVDNIVKKLSLIDDIDIAVDHIEGALIDMRSFAAMARGAGTPTPTPDRAVHGGDLNIKEMVRQIYV